MSFWIVIFILSFAAAILAMSHSIGTFYLERKARKNAKAYCQRAMEQLPDDIRWKIDNILRLTKDTQQDRESNPESSVPDEYVINWMRDADQVRMMSYALDLRVKRTVDAIVKQILINASLARRGN